LADRLWATLPGKGRTLDKAHLPPPARNRIQGIAPLEAHPIFSALAGAALKCIALALGPRRDKQAAQTLWRVGFFSFEFIFPTGGSEAWKLLSIFWG
jgi:hypothetical protein